MIKQTRITESSNIVFSRERMFMLFIRFILFMLFIRERLFIVFTTERLLMLFKFTCTLYKGYLLTYLLTYLLHGAESFLGS